MATALLFILRNKMIIIIVSILSIVGGQFAYSTHLRTVRDDLLSEKSVLMVLLSESQANVIQIKNDLEFQNAAVNALKLAADERQKSHAADVKKAHILVNFYKNQAGDILKRPQPQDKSACDAANILIAGELQNAKK